MLGRYVLFKGTFFVFCPLPPPILVLVSSWKHELTKILMKITATEMRGAKLCPGGCHEEGGLLPPWGAGEGISNMRGVVTSLLGILSRRKPTKDAEASN